MISIIFPCFNEESNLEPLYEETASRAAALADEKFEFIFVDDCSTDRTPAVLETLQAKDPRVKIIRLARNAGSHGAIFAGITFCTGDAAIILAADLQDPPELISRLVNEWKSGFKIAWGARSSRESETVFVRAMSQCYYRLMNLFTTVKLPPRGADVFLIDRAAIDALKSTPEKHTSVFMLVAWLGFRQSTIEYAKRSRYSGKSKWSVSRKLKLALDSLLSFSDLPIRYMSVIGVLTALIGISYAAYIVLWRQTLEILSSILVAVLVLGGIQMLMLGILGEYLWRTYDESRHRPRYIIEYRR